VRVDADELKRITSEVIAAGDVYDDENLGGAECDVTMALEDAGLTPPDAWANASTSITRTSNPERLALFLTRAPESAGDTTEIVERLEWAWTRFSFEDGAYTIRESAEAVRLDFVTWWGHGGFYTGRIKVVRPRQPPEPFSFQAVRQWDYKTIVVTGGVKGRHKHELNRPTLQRQLDELGTQGFELCWVLPAQQLQKEKDGHVLIFKRPRSDLP
jgi:hypothetical protein